MSEHVRRIEAVEKDLKVLAEKSASREDMSKLRTEMKKLYDSLHIGQLESKKLVRGLFVDSYPTRTEFLDLRAHVWGIREFSIPCVCTPKGLYDLSDSEQEVHGLSKKEDPPAHQV